LLRNAGAQLGQHSLNVLHQHLYVRNVSTDPRC
jgi:hypothetical protein